MYYYYKLLFILHYITLHYLIALHYITLYCVEWGVKLYSLTHYITQSINISHYMYTLVLPPPVNILAVTVIY